MNRLGNTDRSSAGLSTGAYPGLTSIGRCLDFAPYAAI